jgi:Ni/Co efflux regulator RcnB
MKTLLISAALAALMLGAPTAFAADDHHDKPSGQQSGHEASDAAHGNVKPPHAAGATSHSSPGGNAQVLHAGGNAAGGNHATFGGATAGRDNATTGPAHVTTTSHSRTHKATGGARFGKPTQGPQVNVRVTSHGTHANIDLHTYQRNVTAQHHFHAGDYHAPQGYSYRRWSYGERLPSLYFGRDYWIGDYGSYDLMAPPDGYVWVRFGPDALLIDEDSGEIVQVEYGVFD